MVLVLCLLFAIWPTHAHGQSKKAVGATLGALSGSGFAYRLYHEDEKVDHFGGIIFGDSSFVFADFSYERLYPIGKVGLSKLHWLLGISDYFSYNKTEECITPDTDPPTEPGEEKCEEQREQIDQSNTIILGAGISFTYGGEQGLNIIFELPLSLRYTMGRDADGRHEEFGLWPIPSLIILYRL